MLPRGPIDVAFDDVGFAYPGGPPVLRDITTTIAAGTRLAVVGETGSGKSTFAKLLTRLMDPSEGRVLLDGIDIRDVAAASLRSSVVLVPQEGFLFDDSIAANVRYGRLDATDDADPRQRRRARPRRLGRGPALRPGHRGRPAWRVDVGGGATAGRAAARPPRRPRPAGARRGDQRRRPAARDAHPAGPRAADDRPHQRHHRPPALDRRGGRRGGRRRPRPDRAARPPRRAAAPGGLGLRRAPCLVGGPADHADPWWDTGAHDRARPRRRRTAQADRRGPACPRSCSSTTPARC